jgi:hypothetical protein
MIGEIAEDFLAFLYSLISIYRQGYTQRNGAKPVIFAGIGKKSLY